MTIPVRMTLDGTGRSVSQIAQETGVSYATVVSWREKHRLGKLDVEDAAGIPPGQRNPGEKLALLLESKTLSEDQKGEWLRQHRLHAEHLPLWEQELNAVMNNKQSDLNQKNAALKKENKRLQKKLAQKEKALAEAAVRNQTIATAREKNSLRWRRNRAYSYQCKPVSFGYRPLIPSGLMKYIQQPAKTILTDFAVHGKGI